MLQCALGYCCAASKCLASDEDGHKGAEEGDEAAGAAANLQKIRETAKKDVRKIKKHVSKVDKQACNILAAPMLGRCLLDQSEVEGGVRKKARWCALHRRRLKAPHPNPLHHPRHQRFQNRQVPLTRGNRPRR